MWSASYKTSGVLAFSFCLLQRRSVLKSAWGGKGIPTVALSASYGFSCLMSVCSTWMRFTVEVRDTRQVELVDGTWLCAYKVKICYEGRLCVHRLYKLSLCSQWLQIDLVFQREISEMIVLSLLCCSWHCFVYFSRIYPVWSLNQWLGFEWLESCFTPSQRSKSALHWIGGLNGNTIYRCIQKCTNSYSELVQPGLFHNLLRPRPSKAFPPQPGLTKA